MKLVSVSLISASDDQLRWFGENVKGLDMAGCKTRTKIMAALGPVMGEEDSIRVPEELAPEPAAEQAEKPIVEVRAENDFTSVMQAPTITVKLLPNAAVVGGKDNVYVNVNTKGLQFARNVPVRMPYPFFEAIQNAVCAEVVQDEDGELREVETNNYPYQVLEPVDPAALAAWRVGTDKLHIYA